MGLAITKKKKKKTFISEFPYSSSRPVPEQSEWSVCNWVRFQALPQVGSQHCQRHGIPNLKENYAWGLGKDFLQLKVPI